MFDLWNNLCALALVYDRFDIPKNIENPENSKLFKRSIGHIRGQLRDYRCSIYYSNLGVHVVEFIDRYEIHIDRYDPYKKPLEHLIVDSPGTLLKIPLILKYVNKNLKNNHK